MASFVNLIDQRRLIGPGGSTVSGDIYFYYSGTSNPAPVFLDSLMTIPAPNPITVGAGEVVPVLFLDTEIIYRRVIVYEDGTIDEMDPLGNLFSEGEVGVPIATVLDYSGAVAPEGFLFCYGQAISRVDYADLFTVIGTEYGAGNGTTTFNIPDYRGRVAAGKDNMGGIAAGRLTAPVAGSTLGAVGGEQSHVLTEAELASHTHTIPDHAHGYGAASPGGTGLATGANASNQDVGTTALASLTAADTGDDAAHNNVQPTIIANKIIKVVANTFLSLIDLLPNFDTKVNASAIGVAPDANHMGTFTGDIIPDNVSAKAGMQALETAVGFTQNATGAVFRIPYVKMQDAVSVKDFGAVGDNISDDTAAIQLAINRGGRIEFPNGTYRISSKLVINNQVNLVGDQGSVVIVATFNTGDVLEITYDNNQNGSVTIDGLIFTCVTQRISGAYINQTGDAWFTYIDRCRFDFAYDGIIYGGTGVGGFYVTNVVIMNYSGIGVQFAASSANNGGGNGFDMVLENALIIGVLPANGIAGVKVTSAGDLTLRHVSTIYGGLGLWLSPGPAHRIQLMEVENCYFDSGNNWGVYAVTNGGRINCLKMTNVWSATNTVGGGMYFGSTAPAPYTNNEIQDLQLIGCVGSNNSGQQGFRFGPNVTGLTMTACSASNNALDGILFDANTNGFTVTNCVSGPLGEFGGNGGRGIAVAAGTSNNYIIANNRTSGNTGTNIVDGGTGVSKIVTPNI